MSFSNWNNQPENTVPIVEAEPIRLVISLPASKCSTDDFNRWSELGDIKIGSDEKNYIEGFTAGLQLTKEQRSSLIAHYKQVWDKAYQRESNPNRKYSQGRYSANSWLRNGAKGFIHRELE